MSKYLDELEEDKASTSKKILGPEYKYGKYIAKPQELGMSGAGNMGALANNIAGILDYTKILVEGTGRASKDPKRPGRPLGNRYFIKTA